MANKLDAALANGTEYTPESWFEMTMYATGGDPTGRKDADGMDEWIGGDRDLAEKRHNDAVKRIDQRNRGA